MNKKHYYLTLSVALLHVLVLTKPLQYVEYLGDFTKDNIVASELSLLPPLITVILAFVTKNVLLSLAFGVLTGGCLLYPTSFFSAFYESGNLVIHTLFDWYHIKILIFSMCLGGLIALCNHNGGTGGIVRLFSNLAGGRKTTQFSAWLMGVAIFFDDYANTLVVGNSMRPLFDRMKLSRAKLAWIVDSTAAPIACIAPVSTWIAFEVGMIESQISQYPALQSQNAYSLFLQSIGYGYYAFFTFFLILLSIYLKRDMGLMWKVEYEEPQSCVLDTEENEGDYLEGHWGAAVVPIGATVLLTLLCLLFTGYQTLSEFGGESTYSVLELLGAGNTGDSLITGSLFGCFLALVPGLWKGCFNLKQAVLIWLSGSKHFVPVVLLLCLSWGLGHQCEALETGTYVAGWAEQNLNILYLPLLVFSISGIIAFSTGTSWGAITIMVPIVFSVTAIHGAENFHLLLGSIACILGGASFGDHCSPVSDTTILSAMASGCDHMMHVRTQIPYALLAGAGSLFGYMVNSILGFGPYPGIVAGLVFTGAVFYSLSKKAAFHD